MVNESKTPRSKYNNMFTKFNSSQSQALLSEGTKVFSTKKKGFQTAPSQICPRKSRREDRAKAFRQDGIEMMCVMCESVIFVL